jgi:hypothetical protein
MKRFKVGITVAKDFWGGFDSDSAMRLSPISWLMPERPEPPLLFSKREAAFPDGKTA